MDKITQKKNEKYSNLISAAYELFEKDGIGGVSIDDIVKKSRCGERHVLSVL